MDNSKKVDVLSIGAWSSENTKQMVRIGSNVLYQFKTHSDVCKQFFKINQCCHTDKLQHQRLAVES